jgi:hypothetical protein
LALSQRDRAAQLKGNGSMRVGSLLMLALLLAGAPDTARAQSSPPSETLQAAQELFSIMSGDILKQLTTQITNAVWPQIEQKARAAKIDDTTIAELRSEFERIEAGFLTDSLKEAPAIYCAPFHGGRVAPGGILSLADGQQGVKRNAARRSSRTWMPCSSKSTRRRRESYASTATRSSEESIPVHSPLNQL